MITDHRCEGASHRVNFRKKLVQDDPGVFLVDGQWFCRACVPPTAHRNCTHALGLPDQACPWCGERCPK